MTDTLKSLLEKAKVNYPMIVTYKGVINSKDRAEIRKEYDLLILAHHNADIKSYAIKYKQSL